jgi:hypothetical protein
MTTALMTKPPPPAAAPAQPPLPAWTLKETSCLPLNGVLEGLTLVFTRPLKPARDDARTHLRGQAEKARQQWRDGSEKYQLLTRHLQQLAEARAELDGAGPARRQKLEESLQQALAAAADTSTIEKDLGALAVREGVLKVKVAQLEGLVSAARGAAGDEWRARLTALRTQLAQEARERWERQAAAATAAVQGQLYDLAFASDCQIVLYTDAGLLTGLGAV